MMRWPVALIAAVGAAVCLVTILMPAGAQDSGSTAGNYSVTKAKSAAFEEAVRNWVFSPTTWPHSLMVVTR